MFQPDKKSTHREVLLFVRSLPRYEVAALCVFLNNNYDAEIPSYSSKDEMLEYIREIEKEDLLDALESLYPELEEEELDEDEDLDADDEEDDLTDDED